MKTKIKKSVTLPELIQENDGPSEFARRFGFDRASTSQWGLLTCLPSPEKMAIIVEKTNGRCSYANMIDLFLANKNKKNK